MIGNARLIERFSDDTTLYQDKEGTVWVVNNRQNTSTVYRVKNGQVLLDKGPGVEHWDRRSNRFNPIIIQPMPLAGEIQSNVIDVDLIGELFPAIPSDYQNGIHDLYDADDKLKISYFLNDYPELVAKAYPFQYLVLLCFSPDCDDLVAELKENNWVFTSDHLCKALDVEQLSHGQRKWLRSIEFDAWAPSEYTKKLKSVLDKWDVLEKKFHHVGSLKFSNLDEMLDSIEKNPLLAQAKWFSANAISADTVDYMPVQDYQLEEAWNYVRIKQQMEFDTFVLTYLKSFGQFIRLHKESDEYFTKQAYLHACEQYPDDYEFPDTQIEYGFSPFELIRTAGKLRQYSADLRICAASYVDDIARGRYQLFYYEHEYRGEMEKGMLQICTQSLNVLLASPEPPHWEQFRLRRVIKQFQGYRNKAMSDYAWKALEYFVEEIGRTWHTIRGSSPYQ